MLANLKILESLLKKKNPAEASDYLKYLKLLAIKGTRFQTKVILAFDQDYRATKSRDNFSWGTTGNVDDLSAQYFDAAVALRLTPSFSSRTNPPEDRKPANQQSATDEFCFRWNFSPMVALTLSHVDTSMFAFTVHNSTKGSLAPVLQGLALKNNDLF